MGRERGRTVAAFGSWKGWLGEAVLGWGGGGGVLMGSWKVWRLMMLGMEALLTLMRFIFFVYSCFDGW